MNIVIRKWGNSAGAIFPAVALAKAGIGLGDQLEMEVKDGLITLKPVKDKVPEYSLGELLKGASAEDFALSEEDVDWLRDGDVGREAM